MSTTVSVPYSLSKYLLRSNFIFVLLFTISFSSPTQYIPGVRWCTDPIFEQLVLWSGRLIFQIEGAFIYQLTSDALGAFIHAFNLILIAILGSYLWGQIQPKLNHSKLSYALYTYIRYYLALQLFLYGFNKIFKCQFFLPEPNTLYTTVGETPKDLLFWSVMGSSYFYTVFGGVLEVLAAALLLFRKTYLVGSLIAFGILSNVLAINIGFNISVKLFSAFFLFLSFSLIVPYIPSLYAFLIHQKFIKSSTWTPTLDSQKQRIVHAFFKTTVIWLLLFECLVPYFKVNNFNDDLQERPIFHGAYAVTSFQKNNIPIPPLASFSTRWKKAFVHRRGYFIIQTMDDKMQDYPFTYDLEEQFFLLKHPLHQKSYQLNYRVLENGNLLLEGIIEEENVAIRLKRLEWSKLPLLAKDFHWTIDAIK